ncbi:MAG: type II secretion system protein M [Proteobacteria bacterium]|jgi:general secretion pathway protein M|nr:type II secretion system protein M [Pseudomonadota bacterium]MBK9253201.1 type II secretion system protein M [Pseudomonadota bacterium]
MIPAALSNWYSRQNERDQRVLFWGGIAAGVIVLALILLPLQRNLSKARARVAQQQADLAWMRQVAPTLAAAGPGPAAAATQPGESLVVLIDRSARESGLAQALTGSQPAANGAMTVRMENADFNLLIGWMSRLVAQHDLRVESASITGNGTAGLVNAAVQLHPR